jgi:glyoxylase-like metal-dependent hydrolase (beta-lactamase superfamily II)
MRRWRNAVRAACRGLAGQRRSGPRGGLRLVALLSSLAVAGPIAAQQIRTAKQMPFPAKPDFSRLQIETLPVQGNVYLLAGAGANVAVQIGPDGVLVVDSGYGEMSDKLLAAIRELSQQPIRTIINTTLADDHTGANAELVAAGSLNQAGPGMGGRPNEGDLIGHADLLLLMAEIGEDRIATTRWPPSTYSVEKKDLYSNGEPVEILHEAATTAGDSMVWFRKSDVLVAGELLNLTSFPHIDVEHGGHIDGVLEGLNDLLDIMVPAHLQEGGTMVIPAHGRIGDEHDVLEYRDMVTIIRDRVRNAIDKGWTLRQIQSTTPSLTYEYEPRFDRDPNWTAEMFVEAIYQNLSSGG